MDAGLRRSSWAWRPLLFATLVLASVGAGGWVMTTILANEGLNELELLILALFVVTFGWIAVSFWTAVLGGTVTLIARIKGVAPARLVTPLDVGDVAPGTARVALVMPVYQEDADQVVAGLMAMHRALVAQGCRERFDVFLLSDTPAGEAAAYEEDAFAAYERATCAEGRSIYRRRAANHRRKVGNLEDFCQRWGADYDFMLVLDADSIMAGSTMVRLAALMEANPDVGLIQSQPLPVGQQTLFGRVLQFANRLAGPLMATGLAFWQGRNGNYWGHNAIVRLDAFTAHCTLPDLPGRPPLGGEILSHDFVEAAFLARAGYAVWLLPDAEGSYEELPGDVIAFATRDRRWCQGNLQHLRLIGLRGLTLLSRLHLSMGALAYLSSLLWLGFLVLSLADLGYTRLVGHAYFPEGYSLFPNWPEDRTEETLSLFAVTMAMLATPRLLALALTLIDRPMRRAFGGGVRVVISTILEIAFSALLAPIMMVHHAFFSVAVLVGSAVGWKAQRRSARALTWTDAARPHVAATVIGILTGFGVLLLAPDYIWWLLPVVIGLVLSIPFVWVTARPDVGLAARRHGLFLIPEEVAPPDVLSHTVDLAARNDSRPSPRHVPGLVQPS